MALGAEDLPAVLRAAHTIKGASANLSGESLRAVALEMELAAKANDLASARLRMLDVDTQFSLLQAAMKEMA